MRLGARIHPPADRRRSARLLTDAVEPGLGMETAWAPGSGGRPLVSGREVAVAVDQFPLAVFEAVDMGDPDLDRARRRAVDAHLPLGEP
jgi:hypothetical protein